MQDYMIALRQKFFRKPTCRGIHRKIEHVRRRLERQCNPDLLLGLIDPEMLL